MGNTNLNRDCERGDPAAVERRVVAERLEEAGLSTDRFINVESDRKQSFDHKTGSHESVRGNYGVYTGGGLVGFDIDDYNDHIETPALDRLPSTFSVKTAHDGEHRYYSVSEDPVSMLRLLTGGAANPSLSWGEIHARNKYLVGPGSEITECSKSGCASCKYGSSAYTIAEDRPIATIPSEALEDVILNDRRFEVETVSQQRLIDF